MDELSLDTCPPVSLAEGITWKNRLADVAAVASQFALLGGALSCAAPPLAVTSALALVAFNALARSPSYQESSPELKPLAQTLQKLSGLNHFNIVSHDSGENSDDEDRKLATATCFGASVSARFYNQRPTAEVLGILAHETGHHAYGFLAPDLLNGGLVWSAIYASAGLVGCLFSVVSGVAAVGLVGASVGAFFIHQAHSRQAEFACDRVGALLTGGSEMLSSLSWAQQTYDGGVEPQGPKRAFLKLMGDHPYVSERVRALGAFCATQPADQMAKQREIISQACLSLPNTLAVRSCNAEPSRCLAWPVALPA